MVLLLAVSRGEECVRVRVLGWRWRGGVGGGVGGGRVTSCHALVDGDLADGASRALVSIGCVGLQVFAQIEPAEPAAHTSQ